MWAYKPLTKDELDKKQELLLDSIFNLDKMKAFDEENEHDGYSDVFLQHFADECI